MSNFQRRFALTILVIVAAAAFPGVASANLFLEETIEAVPTGHPKLAAAKYPTTVTGQRLEYGGIKGKIELLNSNIGGSEKILCNTAEVSGGTLAGPVSQITLVPKFTSCTFAGGAVTVSMNSCSFQLSEFLASTAHISAKIACNSGDAIKVQGTTEILGKFCTVSIPAQSLGSAEWSNAESGGEKFVAAGLIGSGIKYSTNWACSFYGVPEGSYESGKTESDLKLNKVFLEETTEAVPTGHPKLAAAKYPTTVTGQRLEYGGIKGKIELLNPNIGGPDKILCNTAEVSGGTLAGPVSQITLVPKFTSCTFAGGAVTVSMNSCSFQLSEFLASTAHISAKIACNSGDAIKVQGTVEIGGKFCTVSIPAQSLGSTEWSNAESGGEKFVAAGLIGSGIKYSTNWACSFYGVPEGSYESGKTESDLMLKG